MFDVSKVQWTDAELSRGERLVNLYQTVDGALDDGFQPLQDLTVIAPAVWGQVDSIRVFIAGFTEQHGRRPNPGEIAAVFGQAGLMVARHEGVVYVG